MKKNLFCANCQVETEQNFALVKSGTLVELHATCACGRVIKFAGDLTKEQLKDAMAKHKAHNTGQVPAEADAIPVDHPMLKHLASL